MLRESLSPADDTGTRNLGLCFTVLSLFECCGGISIILVGNLVWLSLPLPGLPLSRCSKGSIQGAQGVQSLEIIAGVTSLLAISPHPGVRRAFKGS